MMMLPMMPRRFPSPVALVVGPVGVAAIRRIAIATIAIGRAVTVSISEASAQR